MRCLLIFLIASLAYAQTAQSLVPAASGQEWGTGPLNPFVPPAAGTPYVIQMQLDVVAQTALTYGSAIFFGDNASGINFQQQGCSGLYCLGINMSHETGTSGFQGPLSGTANGYINIQLFHDTAAGGGSNQDIYEAYDRCGNMVGAVPMTYTDSTHCIVLSGSPSTPTVVPYSTNTANSNGEIYVRGGDPGTGAQHFAFVRMCVGTSAQIMTLRGHVPLTSGTCPAGSTLASSVWNFDGSLADSSRNGCYVGAPVWSGTPNLLLARQTISAR